MVPESALHKAMTDLRNLACIGVFLIAGSNSNSTYAENRNLVKPAAPAAKEAESLVRMVSFYLKDGRLVRGRELSRDSNSITLEELQEDIITINTYGRRDMEGVSYRQMPGFAYYLELAEYFKSRSWDLIDDIDDFTKAYRFYEKARQLAEGQDSEIVQDLERRVQILRTDQESWEQRIESISPELRKRDTLVTVNERMKKLGEEVNQILEELYDATEAIIKNYQVLEKRISDLEDNTSDLEKDTRDSLKELRSDVNELRRDINRLYRRERIRRYDRPRVYIHVPREKREKRNQPRP